MGDLDAQDRGMKVSLKGVPNSHNNMSSYIEQYNNGGGHRIEKSNTDMVWEALKALTEGEAHNVIEGCNSEDGHDARCVLYLRNQAALEVEVSSLLGKIQEMALNPAKTPEETRSMLADSDKRVKKAEDAGGTSCVGEGLKTTIMKRIIDQKTRDHVAIFAGDNTYDYRDRIMKFTHGVSTASAAMGDPNAMIVDKPTPHTAYNLMQPTYAAAAAGAMEQWPQEEYSEEYRSWYEEGTGADEDPTGYTEYLGWTKGSGKGRKGKGKGKAGKCYNCQGTGHFARDCREPTRQQGKGKNKGQGKGHTPYKGGGKGKGGPKEGCWTCGGNHYASDCQKGQQHGQTRSLQSKP